MASGSPLSVFTADEKTLSPEWAAFLSQPEINSPIVADPTTASNTTNFSCLSTQFFGCKFTTQANAPRFKQSGPFITDADDAVLLGLDPTVTIDVALTKVLLAFLGVSTFTGGTGGIVGTIISNILVAETDNVTIKLVNDADTRNAMWCIPGQSLTVSTALVFSLDVAAALASVKKSIGQGLGISIGDIGPLRFHLQRTSYGSQYSIGKDVQWDITHTFSLTIQASIAGFDIWLRLDPGGASISLTQSKDGSSNDIWSQLQQLGQGGSANSPPSTTTMTPSGPDITGKLDLLSVSLGKSFTNKFWWRIETVLGWETQTDGSDPSIPLKMPSPVLIGLSYDSMSSTFRGRLLTKSSFLTDKRNPGYLASTDVVPVSYPVDSLPDALSLATVFPEAKYLPSSVPDQITVAEIAYSSNGSQSVLSMSTTLTRSSAGKTDLVPAPFSWDQLSVSAYKATSKIGNTTSSTFGFSASSTFSLHSKDPTSLVTPASLALNVTYLTGSWNVTGHIENLQFLLLEQFFDQDETTRSAALDILGKLTINQLDIFYTYNKGLASSFLFSGVISLGAIELRLFYQYTSSAVAADKSAASLRRKPGDPAPVTPPGTGATWRFTAFLGAANGKSATLGDIVDSIVGPDSGSSVLPEFVKSIEISPATSGANSAIAIEMNKTSNGVVFVLDVNVLGIKFSYMQLGTATKTSRVLRLAVDKLPLIDSITLIDKLSQPFDEMVYLYVSDRDNKGLLDADVSAINGALQPNEKLMYKKVTTKPSTTAAVIAPGHHFMIINKGEVVLDHVFNIAKSETQPAKTQQPKTLTVVHDVRNTAVGTTQDSELVPNNIPSKGSLTKTLGPITVSALSLQYKDKVLWIHMDATLALGPISFGLLGFGIGFLTTGLQLTHLGGIVKEVFEGEDRFRWELHGLALGFDKPPITLAGMFEHDVIPLAGGGSIDSYMGGVGVGFPPYTLVAVGQYSSVTEKDGSEYKSVFIFAKLDGPLVTLEFATISGVRLGFGFNSLVRSPTIAELTDFPFIKNSGSVGAGNNPMTILKNMTPKWVTPKLDSYWFAAGMTITAFDVIAITAVAMFAFRDAGVVISIFANAVAQMPPGVTDTKLMIFYVEIGMVAELDFIDGYFRVEASLAPTSFVLVPQCHLSGGFALAYWFGNNPNAGDFVFSIGGYHRAYQPPPYYPVPTRVGISFQIGDNIQMSGQAYFAITPKVAMAGALIHVSLSVGPVSAYLDATFDALINFHPLHYIVEFSISVGVECQIDIWFIHIHVSVHIGADLHIEGPEFGGYAHVDFWFFGFDIAFGAQQGLPPALELLEFWKTTHQPGPATTGRQDNDPNPIQSLLLYDSDFVQGTSVGTLEPADSNAAFKFILQSGNVPQPPAPATAPSSTEPPPNVPSTGAGAAWHVKGGDFSVGITTEFALTAVILSGTDEENNGPVSLPDKSSPAETVFARPMHVTESLSSTLTVTVSRRMPDKSLAVVGGWQEVAFIKKAVPTALWAPYESKLDVARLNPRDAPPPDLLNASNATRPQAMGVTLSAPKPTLSIAHIPKFKATAAAKQEVLSWNIPDLEAPQSRFLASPLTDQQKKMNPPARWDDITNTWNGLDNVNKEIVSDAEIGILALAATRVFGWDVAKPDAASKDVTTKPWLLNGLIPKTLANGLKDFYLDLPRIAM